MSLNDFMVVDFYFRPRRFGLSRIKIRTLAAAHSMVEVEALGNLPWSKGPICGASLRGDNMLKSSPAYNGGQVWKK
jgi:hypothetical protein